MKNNFTPIATIQIANTKKQSKGILHFFAVSLSLNTAQLQCLFWSTSSYPLIVAPGYNCIVALFLPNIQKTIASTSGIAQIKNNIGVVDKFEYAIFNDS